MDILQRLNPKTVHTARDIFAGLGVVFTVPLAVRFLHFIWLYFLRPSGLSKYALPNAYAMVTGASDGIGKALAHELAGRGFNVVLHGRNPAKLEAVGADIRKSHPACKVVVEVADAAGSHGMKASIEAIAADLESRLDGPLTVLINNCGGAGPQSSEFVTLRDMTAAEVDAMINLNVRFHVQLTRALLPLIEGKSQKQKQQTQKPGLIMYTGSLAGSIPAPWLTIYSPAKEFGNAWIAALGREMLETNPNIEAMGITIGKVTDVSFLHASPTLFMPDARTVARAMLHKVGCGKLNVIGHWGHALQGFAMLSMPESLQTRSMSRAMKDTMEQARLLKLKEKTG